MVRGAVAGFVGEGLGLPAAILSAVLLARHLGPDGFGIFGLAAASAALVGWTLASLFSRATLVLLPAAHDPPRAAGVLLRWALLSGLAAWGAFAVVAVAAADVSGHSAIGPAGAVAGAEILLLIVSRVYRGAHTATGAYQVPGLAAGLFNAARLGGVIAVIGLGGGPIAALLALSLARGVEIAWLHHRQPILPGRGADALPPGAFRRLTGPTLLQAVCLQISYRVDIVLLGLLGTSGGVLGWYAAAQQVAIIPALVAGVVTPMAVVALADAGAGSRRAMIERRSDLLTAGGLLLFVWAAGVAPPLAPVLFGAAFAPAAPLFAWLALGGAGAWLVAIGSGRAAAAGEVIRPAAITAAMLAAAVLGHALAIPRFGAPGAAAVTATCTLLAGLVIHLSGPAHSWRRGVETAAALAIGAGLALASHQSLEALIGLVGSAP